MTSNQEVGADLKKQDGGAERTERNRRRFVEMKCRARWVGRARIARGSNRDGKEPVMPIFNLDDHSDVGCFRTGGVDGARRWW